MKRSTTRWTTTLAATALLGLSAGAWAQTPLPGQQPAVSPPAPTSSARSASPASSPQEHLQQAKTAIDSISPTAVTGKAKTQVAEVMKHLSALDKASAETTATGTAGKKTTRATTAATSWATDVAEIDRLITGLIGPAATTGAPAAVAGTSGTTASKSGAAAAVTLDEATRSKLADVRTHIVAYAAAMSGTQPASSPDASASAPASRTASAPQAASNTTAPSPNAAPPADQEAARIHLTEARTALTELTALPTAAQMVGEPRAQVTQLIANFNELITTKSNWPASYAKVDANLKALIGPNNTDAENAGGVPAVATGATPATGAVGTAGSSTTATLDPSVRAKLIELRTHLAAFEKASGGAARIPAATTATAPAQTPAAAIATAPAQTAAQPGQAPTDNKMVQEDARRHIEAIEAILNATGSAASKPTGTSGTNPPTKASAQAGSTTLDRAQIEQLRMHLNELKKLLGK